MNVTDDPYETSNKLNDAMDLYILCEGFKYTLQEWRQWTREQLQLENDIYLTRGEYATIFVTEINKFLNANGYVLKHTLDSITRRFMHYWLQLYNSGGRCVKLPVACHNGTNAEYEEWDCTFPQEIWNELTEDYIVKYGFDDTCIGYALLRYISDFFWTYIDVIKSSKIAERREEDRRINEEMMYWVEEQNKAPITSKDKTEEVIRKFD